VEDDVTKRRSVGDHQRSCTCGCGYLITLASPTPSGDLSSQPPHRVPYSLRSSTQSTLISHPSWCTPPRPAHRSRVHNNLVSDSKAAATSMSGNDEDPGKMTDSEKLDRILGQLATMNNRLDAHAQWLALLEQEPVQPTGSWLAPPLAATTLSTGPALESHAGAELPSSGAYNGGFGGGRRAPLHSSHRDRYEDGGPRRPNFTFPHFDGEANPLPWINKCDTYFCGMGVHQDERVWQASLHLEGVAAEWFYAMERDIGGILTWSRFIEFLQMRFGPPLRFNGMADLKALQLTGTIEDYTRQFLTILCRCDDMTHRQQINMYTAGLGEPLRTDVEMEMPETLQRAMHLAQVYERRLLLSASSNTTSYQGTSSAIQILNNCSSTTDVIGLQQASLPASIS
jgi:hypothetical protein